MTKKAKQTWIWVFAVFAALIIIVHLALPYWVTSFLNKRLADLGDYRGHIDHVSLSLYRGAYQVHDLDIVKVEGTKQVPFFRTREIDIALSWSALFKGKVVADLAFYEPQVNFVDSEDAQKDQSGNGTEWRDVVNELTPITINQIEVYQGLIAFRNFESEPPVNIQVNDINATLTNLTNVDNGAGRVASLDVKAKALNDAKLKANAQFDPFAQGDFIVALRCEELSLPMLNDLAKAYASLDFKGGTGEVVMEMEAKDSELTGYVKPLFKNVDIFDWEQDVVEQGKNPFQLAWEGLSGGLSGLLTNGDSDRLATRVEFNGSLDDPSVSTWQTIKNTVSNAFLDAYNNQFEGLFESTTDDSAQSVDT
ncbi:DUF748 domain-containing protein [Marinomonas ostreistagni]|uniref:DUF748 domain-containing protein n=1 Tax=Marinomonas ostreistagni TaxID=359209 RepID=UPI00194DD2D3|nr:DUF748 domain-containing protein [Marinomonas ostreistagni]MBM6550137.1 DUF748 domain-containing protein [Marinomonas ostreistagni]